MKHLKHLTVVALICVVLVGCSGVPVTVSVDQQTLNTLNHFIEVLNAQPGAWRSTLNDAIKDLGQTSKEVADQVSQLLNDSASFVGIEARCETDFFRTRITESLEHIRDLFVHDKFGGPMPGPIPGWVCHFSPDHIDLESVSTGRWRAKNPLVNVTGFNFTYAGLPQVELHDSNDKFVRLSSIVPSPQSAYQFQLNFQPEDFQGFQAGGRLVFKWPSITDPNGLAVLLPTPQPPPTVIALPPIMLIRALAWFHTYDDDKNSDDYLSIYLLDPSGSVVAKVEGIGGRFPDPSDRGPFPLQLVGPSVRKDQIQAGTAKLEIHPNGSDVWKFNYRLSLDFSDNTHLECNWNRKVLDQDGRIGLYPLQGAC